MSTASRELTLVLTNLETIAAVENALRGAREVGAMAWAAWGSCSEREMGFLAQTGVAAESLVQALTMWQSYLKSAAK